MLTVGQATICVDEYDFLGRVFHEHRVGRRRPDVAAADKPLGAGRCGRRLSG
ncbi:MAG: hypothetical protein PVG78_00475 [Desulfobacterales bacterium]|jgi:hypothetical protein